MLDVHFRTAIGGGDFVLHRPVGNMDRQLGDLENELPQLDPGVTLVHGVDRRSSAHHRLLLAHLQNDRGAAIWIDAGDTASTYALYELTSNHRLLQGIRIARAWTAYQHYTLVQGALAHASSRLRAIVVPNIRLLYDTDDLEEGEADWLFGATLTVLVELGETVGVPILLTTTRPPSDQLTTAADRVLEWERTREGERFQGDTEETLLYRNRWWWQTTIPYWVELLGTAESVVEDRPSFSVTSQPAVVGF